MGYVFREGAELALIGDADFDALRDIAERYLGFELPDDKRVMVSRRLGLLARKLGAADISEVVRVHLQNPNAAMLESLANCLTTNHTFFHREPQHFERLEKVILPEIFARQRKERDVRVWCAASSTGQEPYELAMYLREAAGTEAASWKLGVLASDVSTKVLSEAKKGIYTREQVAPLPKHFVQRYFNELPGGNYQVTDVLMNDVVYRRFNLLTRPYPFRRRFHIIFCRNVMIYFEQSVRRRVLEKLANSIELGGYLVIGRSESARDLENRFRFLESGVYRKERD